MADIPVVTTRQTEHDFQSDFAAAWQLNFQDTEHRVCHIILESFSTAF